MTKYIAVLFFAQILVAADRICPVDAANSNEQNIFEWHHNVPDTDIYFELYAKGGLQNKDLTLILTRLGVVPKGYGVTLLSVSGSAVCDDFPPTKMSEVSACTINGPRGVATVFNLSDLSDIKNVLVPLREVIVAQNIDSIATAVATFSISLASDGASWPLEWVGRKSSCFEEAASH